MEQGQQSAAAEYSPCAVEWALDHEMKDTTAQHILGDRGYRSLHAGCIEEAATPRLLNSRLLL